MNKGSLIAAGRTAEVFEWGSDRVLKLYFDWCPAHWVDYEVLATRTAHQAGLPVPNVDGIVEQDNRPGIISERIEGPTMVQAIMAQPWKLGYYARLFTDLQLVVHSTRVTGLNPQRFRLDIGISGASNLPETEKKAALDVLRSLPDGDALCHYDLHPMNVIMSARGPVIIDWMGAAQGDPLSDVARTWLLFTAAKSLSKPPLLWAEAFLRNALFFQYHTRYNRLKPFSPVMLDKWKIPIIAVRLGMENIAEEEPRLRRLLKKYLR